MFAQKLKCGAKHFYSRGNVCKGSVEKANNRIGNLMKSNKHDYETCWIENQTLNVMWYIVYCLSHVTIKYIIITYFFFVSIYRNKEISNKGTIDNQLSRKKESGSAGVCFLYVDF